jgi:xyloglucan-specific exo-beta-1,4-glucanase
MRSSDRGKTWDFAALPFKVGGNMPGRGTGERLAVDPANSDILFFGARSGNGLYKSTDGGKSFKKVSSFTATGTYIPNPKDVGGYNGDIHGLTFVTFDSTSKKTDLTEGRVATSRIFVGTADNITASVYVSEDAGKTWKVVEGQPKKYFPHKCKLQPDQKALYLSYGDGTGPYDGTLGAVYRYDLEKRTWTDITPASGDDLHFGFGGLALDMQRPGTVMVAALNSWWPDTQIFRSTDSGKSWTRLWEWAAYPDQNWYYNLSTPKAPWIYKDFISVDSKRLGWMIEALEIDPTNRDHWLYGTGLTVYGGHDLTKWDTVRNVTIQSLADGIEETSVQEIRSVPGGSELLVAVGDVSGFTFQTLADLDASPKMAWDNPMFSTSTSVDFAGNDPRKVVRVGSAENTQQIAVSSDGGVTWNINSAAATTQSGGSVAYSANGSTITWSSANSGVLRSQDQGSFSSLSALSGGAIIAADKRSDKHVYAGSGGNFYVSADKGAAFSRGGMLSGAGAIRDISVHPTVGGDVWVSTDVGIFHSTDFGAAFKKVPGSLTNTYQVSLGVSSGDGWNVYAFGTGSAGARLYASADSGATWIDIQGSTQGFGAIDSCKLAGSGNNANVVYVGTNGRGLFYSEVTL